MCLALQFGSSQIAVHGCTLRGNPTRARGGVCVCVLRVCARCCSRLRLEGGERLAKVARQLVHRKLVAAACCTRTRRSSGTGRSRNSQHQGGHAQGQGRGRSRGPRGSGSQRQGDVHVSHTQGQGRGRGRGGGRGRASEAAAVSIRKMHACPVCEHLRCTGTSVSSMQPAQHPWIPRAHTESTHAMRRAFLTALLRRGGGHRG